MCIDQKNTHFFDKNTQKKHICIEKVRKTNIENVRKTNYVKNMKLICEINNGIIDDREVVIFSQRGDCMKYYMLKMRAMPRVSFAVTNKESRSLKETIEDNKYTMFRYVDSGQTQIKMENGEKIVVSKGEYVITPAGIAYEYSCEPGTISSMFSFYLDDGIERLVTREEIEFEHSDNYVYVDIESLFIPIKGKLLPSEKPYQALRQLIGNYDSEQEYVNVTAGVKVAELFVGLAERSINEIKGVTGDESSNSLIYCERIDKYIEKHYMYPITMTTISRLLVKHENYISRIYKNIRGITVMQHLRNVRIDKAKEFLVTGKYSVTQVAKMVGFHDVKYFITTFKQVENISPGKYQQSLFEERTFSYDLPEFIDEE